MTKGANGYLISLEAGGPKVGCLEAERQALLKIKQDLQVKDQNGTDILSSWGNEKTGNQDCCEWIGIRCSNESGHVVRLDISPSTFGRQGYDYICRGNMITSSLIELKHLNYLDLSYMYLSHQLFPNFIGQLTKLRVLDLKSTGLTGEILYQLANLSSLQVLILGENDLCAKSRDWVSHLSSLRHLDLSRANLRQADDWLDGSIPGAFGNLTFLEYLNLSNNILKGEIPKAIWNICTLRVMCIDSNNQSEYLPEHTQSSSVYTYHSLEFLSLLGNQIVGSLPNLTLFSSLKVLWLGSNKLNGAVSESVGQLAQLEVLDVFGNSLQGVISEAHFLKLSKLTYLSLPFNSLILNLSSDWIPPFLLHYVLLRSCKLGPQFPRWLRTQKNYYELDISNT
ncbi:LRR domain containing protein [Trema orientale]|uniref:LRR domain containing protein n=1 Tax=Trema orientale TaxID=63057 RepID=A0A2P5FT68_TREOI|nr:LRR domain containing protein [Trema orientale]